MTDGMFEEDLVGWCWREFEVAACIERMNRCGTYREGQEDS